MLTSASLSLSVTIQTCILHQLATVVALPFTQFLLAFLPSLLHYVFSRITSQINLLHPDS